MRSWEVVVDHGRSWEVVGDAHSEGGKTSGLSLEARSMRRPVSALARYQTRWMVRSLMSRLISPCIAGESFASSLGEGGRGGV